MSHSRASSIAHLSITTISSPSTLTLLAKATDMNFRRTALAAWQYLLVALCKYTRIPSPWNLKSSKTQQAKSCKNHILHNGFGQIKEVRNAWLVFLLTQALFDIWPRTFIYNVAEAHMHALEEIRCRAILVRPPFTSWSPVHRWRIAPARRKEPDCAISEPARTSQLPSQTLLRRLLLQTPKMYSYD